jgi:hypothetical protein
VQKARSFRDGEVRVGRGADPRKTAEKYGLNLRELNARARREGWVA